MYNFKGALCRMVDGKVMTRDNYYYYRFDGSMFVFRDGDLASFNEQDQKTNQWHEAFDKIPLVGFDTAFTALDENGNAIRLFNWPPGSFLKKENGEIRRFPNRILVVNFPLTHMRLKKWQIMPKDKEKDNE